MFAEELSRSFFPIYVRELYEPIPGLSIDMVISLPISIFMLVVAIAMPMAGRLSDQYGSRNVFLIGLIPSAIGFIGTGLAYSIYDLIAWRCLSAFGYGMMFIACQGYVAANTTARNRTQGMGMFVAAVMVAAMCGPPIGGILADQIGFRAVFFISAVLAIPAALMAYFFLPVKPRHLAAAAIMTQQQNTAARRPMRFKDLVQLFGNVRFVVLACFSALPTKFALTGFIFFLVPLYLNALDNNQSTIGRVLMLYGVAAIVLTPLSASLADKLGNRRAFVALGGILAGLSALIIWQWQTTTAVAISVTLIGIAHAISISPQLALVPEICRTESQRLGQATVISIFRLIERAGAVLGSLVIAAIISFYGYHGAFLGMSLILLSCVTIFCLFFFVVYRDEKPKIVPPPVTSPLSGTSS